MDDGELLGGDQLFQEIDEGVSESKVFFGLCLECVWGE